MSLVGTSLLPKIGIRSGDFRARHAMVSAYQGFFVDMTDVYLPVIALAPAIAYFTPEHLPPSQASVLYFMTFTATLIGRPVGALLFGSIADRVGRRKVTIISIAGFSVCTMLVGLLPGYGSVGLLAPALLTLLRFVDGIFLGGEYTSATPLAYEYCDKDRRGIFGGVLQGAYTVAYIVISLLTLLMLAVAPNNGPGSPYFTWGWRVPFFAGALLGVIFLVYRARNLPESELWEKTKKSENPLRSILAGAQRNDFWQVFVMMTGFWLTSNLIVAAVPRVLLTQYKVDSSVVTGALIITMLFLYAGFVTVGTLSEKFGRRPTIMVMSAVMFTAGLGVLWLFVSEAVTSTGGLLVLATLVEVILISIWGVATPYCNERFRTAHRSSGFALGYSLSVVIPSFYGFYMEWLGHVMPANLTMIPLIAIGCVLIFVGAWWGPETKGLDFRAELEEFGTAEGQLLETAK